MLTSSYALGSFTPDAAPQRNATRRAAFSANTLSSFNVITASCGTAVGLIEHTE